MAFDTEERLQMIRDDYDRRLEEHHQQNKDDFREIKDWLKEITIKIDDTRMQVVGITTALSTLVTRAELSTACGELKQFCIDKLEGHFSTSHRCEIFSVAKTNGRLIAILGALVAALSGGFTALIEMLKNAQ